MRNMKLRLISAALATCMMASAIPVSAVTAFADDANNSVVASEEDPMGTLIPNNNGAVYEITQAGTYQMKGTYDAPVDVMCDGVTINITGDVEYVGDSGSGVDRYENYAIRAKNEGGKLTIKNDGHTFRVKVGTYAERGVLRIWKYDGNPAKVEVIGGHYVDEGNNKEMFFNWYGNMTLTNITAEGQILVKGYGGKTKISGGKYTSKCINNTMDETAIVNKSGGTMSLENVDVYSADGSCVLNIGGSIEVEGGTFTTDDEENAAIQSEVIFDNKGQPTWTDAITTVINGATIKDSNRAITVKDGKITLKDITFENNTSDIYLSENQKLDDVIDTTDYTGKPLTAKVTTENVGTTLETIKDATLTVEGGKVTVDAASIGDEAIETTVNDKTTTVKLPVGAVVTVEFDETAYSDSNLEFGYWYIKGLADAENYKNKKEFTFEVPNSDVTIKAMTSTEPTDDSIDAATVITGVAIGAGAAVLAYHIGTELYAEQVLGKGVAVPRTREDVALKAWELAGKPAVELNGEPLSEIAQAEKWAAESGLMQNVDGSFNGAKKMNKLKALRVLDSAKKMNAQ